MHVDPCRSRHGCEHVGVSSLIRGMVAQWLGGKGRLSAALVEMQTCYAMYNTVHPAALPASFSLMYITMQACAIPGTLWLSILSGALFPPLLAQALVAGSAVLGSSLAFVGSALVARRLVAALAPETLASFRAQVASHEGNLLWYVLFLRITPLFPNWALNLCSPIVGVPYPTFLFATAVGLLPANYSYVHLGAAVGRMGGGFSLQTLQEDPTALVALLGMQALVLSPVLYKRLTAAAVVSEGDAVTESGAVEAAGQREAPQEAPRGAPKVEEGGSKPRTRSRGRRG